LHANEVHAVFPEDALKYNYFFISQKKNMCLLISFLSFPFFDLYFGSAVATLQDMIAGSVQKCFVPIVTTILSFGTI
jgi:hypothetical protein